MRFNNISIRHLEYVMTVAQEGNLTNAAHKLFIAQPSLSQSIKKVENELGVVLFSRRSNRLKLTRDGELFVAAGKRIFKVLRDLNNELTDHANQFHRTLILGMPYMLGALFAFRSVAEYRKRYPNALVQLKEASTHDLEKMLADGEIDIAIIPLPLNDDSLAYKPLFSCRMTLIMSKGNPLNTLAYEDASCADRKFFNLKNARDANFILSTDIQRTYKIGQMIFQKAGFTPNVVMRSRNIVTIKQLVAVGDEIAIIPECYLDEYEYTGKSLHVYYLDDSHDYPWDVVVSYLDSGQLSAAASQYIRLLDEQLHCTDIRLAPFLSLEPV